MQQNPQYIVLFHHLRLLLAQAAAAGIEVMPLKGAHLLTRVYPAGASRGLLADIDLMVRPHQMRAMDTVMRAAGFMPRDVGFDEGQTHEQGYYLFFENGKRVLFELHRHIVDPRRYKVDIEGIWARAVKGSFEGTPCYWMSDEDLFCYLCLHGALHRFISFKRDLNDVTMILSRTDINMVVATERAIEWGCKRMVWAVLMGVWETNPQLVDKTALDKLCPGVIQKSVLRRLLGGGSSRLLLLPHRLQAAVLWPFLFDDKRALLKFLVNHPRLRSIQRQSDGESDEKISGNR